MAANTARRRNCTTPGGGDQPRFDNASWTIRRCFSKPSGSRRRLQGTSADLIRDLEMVITIAGVGSISMSNLRLGIKLEIEAKPREF
jgi:hypothetical protein